MKIAVCDDNARDMANIKTVFNKIKEQFELDIKYYSSGEEIISDVSQKNADYSLVILDIYMKELDGIETARRLRRLIPKLQIAFITSSSDFAVEAFDLRALHYIIKPVTKEKLHELMERFFGRTRSAAGNIEVKSRTKTYTFPMLQIQKIVSSNKGVDVHMKNGDTVHIPESFAAVLEQLDTSIFLKISRGLAVNMSYILCMNNEICRFRDGTETLISRRDKAEIRRRYNDYLFDAKEDSYDST